MADSGSCIKTDGQSASLSWNKVPIWGLRPHFYYCQTVVCLLMWGAVSDERTGVSFTIAHGPRQRIHSRIRVPWDSWPYITVSDSRLPFRRLLWLEGLRWRYSPPSLRGLLCCLCMRCHGNHSNSVVTNLLSWIWALKCSSYTECIKTAATVFSSVCLAVA
jgi:hypothetical protein